MEYICFCNECGHKKETDNKKEFEFCPACGHINTGFVKLQGQITVEVKEKGK